MHPQSPGRLYATALLLARITVFYNIAEGMASLYFGAADETLSLFGFGVDSFVEVISGIGIWHMISRIMRQPSSNPDEFERTALHITGTAFYVLAAGLVATAAINLSTGQRPETTFWGIVISLISIFTMWLLIYFKLKVGRALHSDAIIADAQCTKTCLYLSLVLLFSSLGFELTKIGWVDSMGAVVIAFFSFQEGKEAFDKSRGKSCSCQDCG